MPNSSLWAGALSLLLIHNETGCRHSALNAARLLEHLGSLEGVDSATQTLCERASIRLSRADETQHACAA